VHFVGVARGAGLSFHPPAKEIDQHIVIVRALGFVPHATVVDAQKVGGFYGKAGLFAGLADGGLAQRFSQFQHAPGDGPFAGQWRMSALDQQDAPVLDDDRAYAHERRIGIFTFHRREVASPWIEPCNWEDTDYFFSLFFAEPSDLLEPSAFLEVSDWVDSSGFDLVSFLGAESPFAEPGEDDFLA
jgi:hypothetical protein